MIRKSEMTPRRSIAVSLLALAALGAGTGPDEAARGPSPAAPAGRTQGPRPATMSVAEIRAAVEAAHRTMRSLLAEIHTRYWDRPRSTTYNRLVLAAKGTSRYLRLDHISKEDPGPDPDDHESIYHAGQWNVYYPYHRRYEVSRKYAVHPYTVKARGSLIFECLGWWPPDDDSAPPDLDARPFFLLQVLARGECRVHPNLEEVDGRWCHLVEIPGSDRLWIDGDRGLLVRREREGRGAGASSATYELGDYREVAAGVVLPYRLRRTLRPRRPEEGQPLDTLVEVARYEVNNVSDRRFEFTPPAGTLVYDRDTDTWSQVPGGFSHMETLVGQIRKQLEHAGPHDHDHDHGHDHAHVHSSSREGTARPVLMPAALAGGVILCAAASRLLARVQRRGVAAART